MSRVGALHDEGRDLQLIAKWTLANGKSEVRKGSVSFDLGECMCYLFTFN